MRFASFLSLPAVLALAALATAANRPNVLFIAVDDLRPQLGCYGFDQMHTPHIDKLAEGGVVFSRAYCMVPTCGASRASLMTGIRPTRERFVNYLTWAERDAPGVTTLNTHFHKQGYYTQSLGKVFHHPADNAQGWSEPAWRPKGMATYRKPENLELAQQRAKQLGKRGRGPAYESADVEDEAYADGVLARRAVAELRRLKQREEPFFLAVGFFKPHLPFVAPKKYWDIYDPETIQTPATYHRPANAPPQAIHNFGELRSYASVPKQGPVSDAMARNLIRGYYACVSYTDAQIGKLLAALHELKLDDNTIVVLWGDHGWNLGEHTLWCKHSCFETSMRTTLVVKAPGIAGGKRTEGLTELIDVYPTLCELAGLPTPSHLQGQSFAPLLKEPGRTWKASAVGRYKDGDTIRTGQYRFTEYSNGAGKQVARMLYDHQRDAAEDANIAVRPENDEITRRLTKQLHQVKSEAR